jgi:hypothetical protein
VFRPAVGFPTTPIATHAGQKLKAYVILPTDEDMAEAKAKKLERVVLAVGNPQGPSKYEITKEADVTVVKHEPKTVKSNFAFAKGKLTDKEADTVAAAVKDILPTKKADK